MNLILYLKFYHVTFRKYSDTRLIVITVNGCARFHGLRPYFPDPRPPRDHFISKFNAPCNATQISQPVRQTYGQVSREYPNFRCWNPAATCGDEWLRARISR